MGKTARKQATNLSIRSDLLRQARARKINLSQTLEETLEKILKEHDRQAWAEENREAVAAANRFINEHGLWSDGLREVLMAQFDIYPGTGEGCDFLLELQDDMLDELSTRVVAPLVAEESLSLSMRILNPRLVIDGRPHLLLTHLLAAIPKKSLGQPVGNASSQRDEIVASIDMLFTGI